VLTPSMVPVLFMRAVMAAEQVGAGREELEDFDEAVDGEPVLMADPSPRATPRRWQATATNFFWGADIGGSPHCAPRGPIGGARSTGALQSRSSTCRPVALITDHRYWIAKPRGIKQKSLEGIFSFPTGPCARAPERWDDLRAANDRPLGMLSVSSRSWPKFCAL
jgi:hypothetical protein